MRQKELPEERSPLGLGVCVHAVRQATVEQFECRLEREGQEEFRADSGKKGPELFRVHYLGQHNGPRATERTVSFGLRRVQQGSALFWALGEVGRPSPRLGSSSGH